MQGAQGALLMFGKTRSRNGGPPLFTHAPMHGISFGVLRRRFSGRQNDPGAFLAAKMAPALPDGAQWRPTSARSEILLPTGVADIFMDPATLARSFMDHLPSTQEDLLICLKVTLDGQAPLHEGWETMRAFAVSLLVRDHGLPTALVLHDPAMSGQHGPSRPHIHAMAFARRFAPRGWAERSRLARDKAHGEIAEAWKRMQ